MGYAESLLADGERIVFRRRQHWLAVVLEGRSALVLVVGGIALGLLREVVKEPLRGAPYDLVGWIALAMVAGGLLWFAWRLWGWYAQAYLVTTRRVIKIEGIVNKQAADSSLEKINDAVLIQNWLARLLDYGDLEIMTASETQVDRFWMLAGAREFKREMLNAKYALETDVARPAASPPLRATDLTRGEATELLARLAELRDSGAITAEEYEAKKRDLLERI
jgi:uncharacterized membrane protein YdbT with pleckstrin-like domain